MLVIGQCNRTVPVTPVQFSHLCALVCRLSSLFSVHCHEKKSTVVSLFMKMFNQWLFCFSNFVIVLINNGNIGLRVVQFCL